MLRQLMGWQGTAAGPQDLVRRLKATIRLASNQHHHDAIERELKWQLWSMEQPGFRDRVATLKQRIAKTKGKA